MKHLEEFESNDSKFVIHKSELVEVETAGDDQNWNLVTADLTMTQRVEKDDDKFKAFEPIVVFGGGIDNGFVLSRAVDLADVLLTFAQRSAEWRDSEEGRSTMEEI